MTSRRLKASDAVWLLVALLVQSALLFLPYNKPQKLSRTKELISVRVDIQSKVEPVKESPVLQKPAEVQQPKQDQAPAIKQNPSNRQEFALKAEPSQTPDAPPLTPKRLSSESSTTRISAAQLLVAVSELEFPSQESEKTRKLGVSEPLPLPVNWLPKSTLEDNLFNDKMIPGSTEIVDQWNSADGGYNAIVKTASGKTFCGHAQPQNRIGSMEASVVMWRPCD